MTNIEVEIRSFLTKEQYTKLKKFFNKNAELIKEDSQETIYFNSKEDLRIQQNNTYSKIWLKKGKLHDDSREEIEIHTERNNFKSLLSLFQTLGYKIDIKWIRDRRQYQWEDITICLDYTKGYGYILELEILTSEDRKKDTLKKLRSKLKELKIEETPKEEFKKAYNEYKENWKELIAAS